MLDSIPEVFAKHELDFGCTDKVKHEIKLSDETAFKQRPRPIHPQDLDAVRKHIKELLESGVIRESSSPFASPIVVVRKKNGSVRLCIDYRKLNAQTIKDAYALPKLEDTFSALSGSRWFSVLDLKSGYYQIEMEERDKSKTAFVCPVGFYEFNRMPQGVTNAPTVPTPNQTAKTVAKVLWDNFLVHYGMPERLHSDQGPDFESRTIKELCQMAGIHKIRTTPYHPRGNPVERFNRTLLSMLGTLNEQDKTHWKDFVKPLVHAYNCTRNDVTGYSPYELMFGRQPRLPVDLAFGLPVSEPPTSHSQYVDKLRSHLQDSYNIAMRNSEKVMSRNKQRFDKQVTAAELSVGDRVLVRNVKLRGKHKLADKWESEVYIVTKKAGTLPVYTVHPEGKDRPVRTLHRDLLLPCGYLSPSTKPSEMPRPKPVSTVTSDTSILHESEDQDLCELPYLPDTSSSAPIRFTTTIDLPVLPAAAPPVVPADIPVTPPGQPSPCTSEEMRPVGVADETESGEEPEKETEKDGTTDLSAESFIEHESESAVADAPEPEPEEVTSSPSATVVSQEPLNLSTESASSVELSSPESEPPIRRPTRARRQPDRLQYSKLGQPLLHSIQSLFQGLSTAFSSALQLEESPLPDTLSEDTVRCQPSACPRPYMKIGGGPVTRI
ncbi:hypothetical protein WMY93_012858 [Mugilogobius chulae]|uniref:Integrase catalytic domain-containing protein n=1 Tax=Mugilogobius chulae TaxID=88201 RepID=A0AAW0P7I6_9GOBI